MITDEKMTKDKHEILVVDDTPASLQLLTRILTNSGYRVRPATDGLLALRSVAAKAPDLILLDVKMPNMDGFEVCRRLKSDVKSREIPVLFISALGETSERIKGFETGGLDYISKPFETEDVLARVRTHLRLRDLTEQLEQKVRQRTKELSDANLKLQNEIEENKLAQKALLESEDRYRRLVDGSPDVVYIFSSKRGGIFYSPHVEDMLGYSVGYLYAHPFLWNESIHPEDKNHISEIIKDFEVGKYFSIEYRIKDAAGSWKWVRDRSIGRITEDNEVLIEGVATDVTEQKMAEQALKKSNNNFATLVANIPGYVAYVNADTLHYEFVNDMYEKGFGIPKKRIIGSHIKEIIGEKNYLDALKYIQEVSLGKPVSYENLFDVASGKRWVQVNYAPIIDADAHVSSIVVLSYDITERKLSEEALRNERALIENVMETSPVGITTVDSKGNITYANSVAIKILCLSKDEVSHRTYNEPLWHITDLSGNAFPEENLPFNLVMSSGKPVYNIQHAIQWPDGKRVLLSVNAAPLIDGNGQINGMVAGIEDITERKYAEEEKARLEAQLQQSQKMESVGRLAGGVAHDFNNMLGVIIGHTEMALDQVDPKQPLHEDLEEILKAAERSANLTQQLLAFARKQTISPRVLDLNSTISSMLRMLRRLIGEDIVLSWKPSADLWQVKMDPSQIDQILANLCVNARDAIKDGGIITIETGNKIFDKDYCLNHGDILPGEYVSLSVSDNGQGMDKETLSHIFEPFFTTKGVGVGTGLGLATVYGAIRQNEGYINAYSEPGHGTTFTIYMPRHVDKSLSAQTNILSEPEIKGHETILLVEDESIMLKMTSRMLEWLGYKVLAASSPGEALRMASEHSGEVHLLMTDVIMPGMNGRDLAQNIMSLYPHIKRLFMSGYTADIIAHHGVLDAGVQFIQKPFSKKELAAKIRNVLDKNN